MCSALRAWRATSRTASRRCAAPTSASGARRACPRASPAPPEETRLTAASERLDALVSAAFKPLPRRERQALRGRARVRERPAGALRLLAARGGRHGVRARPGALPLRGRAGRDAQGPAACEPAHIRKIGGEPMSCDLHTHSTFSDGTCTPEEIVSARRGPGPHRRGALRPQRRGRPAALSARRGGQTHRRRAGD